MHKINAKIAKHHPEDTQTPQFTTYEHISQEKLPDDYTDFLQFAVVLTATPPDPYQYQHYIKNIDLFGKSITCPLAPLSQVYLLCIIKLFFFLFYPRKRHSEKKKSNVQLLYFF